MDNPLSSLQPFTDPEFEAYFKTIEKEQLALAAVQGKADGLENKPLSLQHYRIQIVIPLKNAIQKGLDFNHTRHQPVSNVAIAQTIRSNASEKVLLLGKEKHEKDKKITLLKHELPGLRRGLKSFLSSKLKFIIPALFGIAEGALIFNILQSSSLPGFVIFFLAFTTALITAFGLHLGANFICKAKRSIEKWKRYIIVLAIAFAVACALGIWRATLYNDITTINSQIDLNEQVTTSNSSAWPFIILSFNAFLVALAFEIKFWQSDEEKLAQERYEEKVKEIRKAEQERDALKKDIDATKTLSLHESGTALQRQEYARSNEFRLVSLAQQIISHYEGINIEFRTDDQCPAFFGEKIDFGFTFYFAKLFTHLKENK